MHLHLNPLGGLAGDMFCAALLDARPELLATVRKAIANLNMPQSVQIELLDAPGNLGGKQFRVNPECDTATQHPHATFRDIQHLLQQAALSEPVRRRALAIFTLLAEAEGKVHGVAPSAVHFHEVGNWDSIADIVSAAALLDALAVHTVSYTPLPLGGGRVASAHGLLPAPAPATALLLQGLSVSDDGIGGERVTPTGAAILQSLHPGLARPDSATLLGSGMGFGSRVLPGLPNCLQILCLETPPRDAFQPRSDRVSSLCFEVDDQTPEDLALALEHLRAMTGVLSVTCLQAIGKHGRPTMRVELLCQPQAAAHAAAACFRESTTIGLRQQHSERWLLPRQQLTATVDGQQVEVKQVRRPDGATAKIENRELANIHGHAERQRWRDSAKTQATPADDTE